MIMTIILNEIILESENPEEIEKVFEFLKTPEGKPFDLRHAYRKLGTLAAQTIMEDNSVEFKAYTIGSKRKDNKIYCAVVNAHCGLVAQDIRLRFPNISVRCNWAYVDGIFGGMSTAPLDFAECKNEKCHPPISEYIRDTIMEELGQYE